MLLPLKSNKIFLFGKSEEEGQKGIGVILRITLKIILIEQGRGGGGGVWGGFL
jgi:hypothetical protein